MEIFSVLSLKFSHRRSIVLPSTFQVSDEAWRLRTPRDQWPFIGHHDARLGSVTRVALEQLTGGGGAVGVVEGGAEITLGLVNPRVSVGRDMDRWIVPDPTAMKNWRLEIDAENPIWVLGRVLATLHQAAIHYMSNPIILCDFLTRSYDIRGVVSVLALSSLFILMTQHGLEYPNFYEKLCALLLPSIFMAKQRAMFFQVIQIAKLSHC
ncbi:hypothetical protein F3Y22_tig00003507pilonHSYRG00090 [Hibiscus syriacus]|uniref:CCAAT-binding factor domain-containing protein n=1 Tax=Hibiscus syriacus TaxID=106335 RepID=A0A6A3CJP0_HIBSY|nr:hypothetical protein F3Y22_tig00003507pilonHSYRG00090 [Hibiscus syriacus]